MKRASAMRSFVGLVSMLTGGSTVLSPALGQDVAPTGYTPVVIGAAAPLYPHVANEAYITGVAKIEVTTDGVGVARVEEVSGPPMLVKAAEENIRTWKFDKHKPTSFVTTFEYEMTNSETVCGFANGTTTMTLPLKVHIRANVVSMCDPVEHVPANR